MNARGYEFEEKVAELLQRLQACGLGSEIERNVVIEDRDGNGRKIDMAFTLVTDLVDIRVAIECKYREKPLTLDQVDQIKTFRREIPNRSIFWLVTESGLNSNAALAVQRAGISHYTFADLAKVVESIIERFGELDISALRSARGRFARMNAGAMRAANDCLGALTFDLFEGQGEILSILWSSIRPDRRDPLKGWLEKRGHIEMRNKLLGRH